MSRMITYLKERSPIVPLALVGVAATCSTQTLANIFSLGSGALSSALIVLALILLRLMDEVKDYEKDLVAHPDRPLPRGLVTKAEIERAIYAIMALFFAIALVAARTSSLMAGVAIALTALYAWLMYKEFYVGRRLADYPMIYAITHQAILFPLYAIPLSLVAPDMIHRKVFVDYVIYNLSASMLFEMGRKLDPHALPILKTYLSMYGRTKTTLWMFVFVVLGAGFAVRSGLTMMLLPFQILVAASILFCAFKPEKYKLVEGLAVLSSLVHLWAPFINRWVS